MTQPTPNQALSRAAYALCKQLKVHSLEAAFAHCYRAHYSKSDAPIDSWEHEMIEVDALRCGAARQGFPEYVTPFVERYIASVT